LVFTAFPDDDNYWYYIGDEAAATGGS